MGLFDKKPVFGKSPITIGGFVAGSLATALLVAACVTPWYSYAVSSPWTGYSCSFVVYRYWTQLSTGACSQGTQDTNVISLSYCPCGVNNWQDLSNCGNYCHVNTWFYYAQCIVAAAAAAMGTSVVLALIATAFGIGWIPNFKIPVVLSVCGTAAAIAAFAMFCWLPGQVLLDQSGSPPKCPNQASWCSTLTGSVSSGLLVNAYPPQLTNFAATWSPSIGWILTIIASFFGLVYTGLIVGG